MANLSPSDQSDKAVHKIDATAVGSPQLLDWLCLGAIIIIGGSSFALIRGAVSSMPPVIITVVRLWVGALLLLAIMYGTGRRFPPLIAPAQTGYRLNPVWGFMILIGAIGTTVPFFIFPWAQQYVDSGLAGIYMATMPVWTLGLAAIFADETLSGRKLAGFALGFVGVLILMGPAIFGSTANSNVLAQVSMVIGTLFYAASAVLTRRAPPIRPRVFAAGTILAAAIMATPALFLFDWKQEEWTTIGLINTVALGIFSTGISTFLIVIIIQRVGAGFMSFSNYITPICAIILGALIFKEALSINAFIALAVVICGLAISQSKNR